MTGAIGEMNEMSDVITETGQSAASLARQKAERITRRDKGAGGLSAEPPKVFGRALTVDHTCDNKLEVARVEEAGGFVEPPPGFMHYRVWSDAESFRGPGLLSTRSIGDHASKRLGITSTPETASITLGMRDKFLILATDGVWHYVGSEQAADRVWAVLCKFEDHPKRAEFAALALIRLAMKFWRNEDGGLRDDISATVVVLPCFPVGDGSRNATFSPEATT